MNQTYVLYGVHLQWSYYDHPPLVGWLQALILPFSHSDGALRAWAMLFNIATALVLYRLVRVFFRDKNAWLAFASVAFFQVVGLFHVLSVGLIPQVPFLCFSLLAILKLYRVVEQQKLSDFIYLGLFLGLAALSEYTAILLVVITIIYIVTKKTRVSVEYATLVKCNDCDSDQFAGILLELST